MERKKVLTKILTGFLVFLLVFNFTVASFATDPKGNEDAQFEDLDDENDGFGDGLVGTLTSVIRIPIVLIGDAISVVLGMLGKSAGVREGTEVGARLTPEDVLFNKLQLVSLNFFDEANEGFSDPDGGTASGASAIQEIRKNVAIWYYAIRNIALGILLCIFIYVAIRMILSTVASDKAVYRKMLEDWIVGIVLLFMLHYIIVGSIMINNILVEDVMGGALAASSSATGANSLGDYTVELRETAKTVTGWLNGRPPSATRTWGAAIVYIMIVFITLTFLYKYIMRMLTIGFLIIISPLITITYSIDKMGDGKSQALNTWLKEFEYNILIQPFHCIMYMVFVKTSIDILDGTLAGMVLAILCMKFIWDGEKIIKNIFGFNNAKSVGDSLIAAGGAITAMKTVGGLAKTATVGAGGGAIKGTGGNGGGGNAALAGKAISGSPTQTAKLKDSPTLREADQKQARANNPKTQELRDAYQNKENSAAQRAWAGAQLGARGAANVIGTGISNKVHNGINTIKGVATNPGVAARGIMRGSIKAAFSGVALGAALATGNIGMVPDAMKAGWAIGGYAAQKADSVPARISRQNSEEKFRRNASNSASNLRGAGTVKGSEAEGKLTPEEQLRQDELNRIKGKAAGLRRDEHGKKMDATQAFGEESISEMIQDYKEHGSGNVNDQYNDAVTAFHQQFGDKANGKDMLALGNMDADEFQKALLKGDIPGIGELSDDEDVRLQQQAAAYNFYDASQRKALIDNADRMQGEELRLGNSDAQKDVSGMMKESMVPPKEDDDESDSE